MTIYLVIDFFEKVRRFLRYDANWLDVLTYFLLKTPAISFQIAPLAILMATLLTFGLLSRGHEITAMRSCGISLLWVTSPFIVFAAGISLVLLLFSSTVIPLAASKSEEIRTMRIEKKPPAAAVTLKQPWTRVGADSLMHVTSVSVGGELLGGVRLFQFDRNFQLADMTEADEARYRDSTWTLYQGRHRQFFPDGTVLTTVFDHQAIVLTLIPDDFTTWLAGDSELMTFHDIRAYSRRRHQQGSQAARLTDRLLQPNCVPVRHRDHGPGRHCAESAPEWDQRGQHGDGHWAGARYRLLLLDDTLDCDRARPWRGLDASDRRLDGQRALHEFWPLSDVQRCAYLKPR